MLLAITPLDHMYVNVSLVKIIWLWWWLPLRLSKRQSPLPTTVLLRTTLTRTIKPHYYLKIIIIKFCKIIKDTTSALIGQKTTVDCSDKPMENWSLCYKSNRPHFISVYQRSKRLQMLGNHSKKKKKKKKGNQSPPTRNYKLFSCPHNIPRGLSRQ